MNVDLSFEETYADIRPVRSDPNGVRAFVSIMRGCNNMCSYCIVPFTRGRERSRDPTSILSEVRELSNQGFKEVTLLGQNVNSYFFKEADSEVEPANTAEGFENLFDGKSRRGEGMRFGDLLREVASVDPEMRVRFTSPHPKDFTDDVIEAIAEFPNIANGLHLPAQSGSTRTLQKMRRMYTREAYDNLVSKLRIKIPKLEISSDFIAGFCGETEDDHLRTVDLIEKSDFAQAFLFAYSEREKTHAHRKHEDDVPLEVKKRRLAELIAAYKQSTGAKARELVGSLQLVLVEEVSKRDGQFVGRIDGLRKAVFPNKVVAVVNDVPSLLSVLQCEEHENVKTREVEFGDYVVVRITDSTAVTLMSEPVAITKLQDFYKLSMS